MSYEETLQFLSDYNQSLGGEGFTWANSSGSDGGGNNYNSGSAQERAAKAYMVGSSDMNDYTMDPWMEKDLNAGGSLTDKYHEALEMFNLDDQEELTFDNFNDQYNQWWDDYNALYGRYKDTFLDNWADEDTVKAYNDEALADALKLQMRYERFGEFLQGHGEANAKDNDGMYYGADVLGNYQEHYGDVMGYVSGLGHGSYLDEGTWNYWKKQGEGVTTEAWRTEAQEEYDRRKESWDHWKDRKETEGELKPSDQAYYDKAKDAYEQAEKELGWASQFNDYETAKANGEEDFQAWLLGKPPGITGDEWVAATQADIDAAKQSQADIDAQIEANNQALEALRKHGGKSLIGGESRMSLEDRELVGGRTAEEIAAENEKLTAQKAEADQAYKTAEEQLKIAQTYANTVRVKQQHDEQQAAKDQAFETGHEKNVFLDSIGYDPTAGLRTSDVGYGKIASDYKVQYDELQQQITDKLAEIQNIGLLMGNEDEHGASGVYEDSVAAERARLEAELADLVAQSNAIGGYYIGDDFVPGPLQIAVASWQEDAGYQDAVSAGEIDFQKYLDEFEKSTVDPARQQAAAQAALVGADEHSAYLPDRAEQYGEALAEWAPDDSWTQEELEYFYSVWGSDLPGFGQDAAKRYGEQINRENRTEQRTAMTDVVKAGGAGVVFGENGEDNAWHRFWNTARGVAGLGAAVAGMPSAFGSWVDKIEGNFMSASAFNGNVYDAGNSIPTFSDYTEAYNQGISERLNVNNPWAVIPENVPVIGGKGLGELHQIAQSMTQSWFLGKGLSTLGMIGGLGEEYAVNVAEAATLALFFGQAADQAYDQALYRGASPVQAGWISFFSGCAEVLGEKVSLEYFLKTDKPWKLGNMFMQGGIEGFEEVGTNAMNLYGEEFAARMTGGRTAIEQEIIYLMSSGFSYNQASKEVWRNEAFETAWDFVSGAISGMGSGAGMVLTGQLGYNGQGSESRDSLLYEARAKGGQSEALANKYEKGRFTNAKAMNLMDAMQTADTGTIQNAVKTQLQERIEQGGGRMSEKDLQQLAAAVTAVSQGTASNAQQRMVQDSRYATAVLNEMTYGYFSEDGYDPGTYSGWADDLGTTRAKTGAQSVMDVFKESQRAPAEETENLPSRFDRNVTANGEKVSLKGIKADGTVTATNSKGETVTVDKADLSDAQRDVVDYLTDHFGDQAGAILDVLSYGSGSLASLAKDADIVWTLAQGSSMPFNARFVRNSLRSNLAGFTDVRIREIWEAARNEKGFQQRKKEGKKYREYAEGERVVGEKYVVYEDGRRYVFEGVDLKNEDLDEDGKALVAMAGELTKAAGGRMQINFYHGGDSKIHGQYYNGRIDVNIDRANEAGESLVTMTLSHELTHFIQDLSKDAYGRLKNFMIDRLMKSTGKSLEQLIEEKQARDPALSRTGAIDEIIADGCELMLNDGSLIDALGKINQSDAEKVVGFVKGFLNRISKAIGAMHYEASEMGKYVAEQQKIWNEALLEAMQSGEAETKAEKKTSPRVVKVRAIVRQAQEQGAAEITNTEGETVGMMGANGTARMSLDTWRKGGRAMLQAYLRGQVEDGHLTEADVKDMMRQMDTMYEICDKYDDGTYASFSAWSNATVVTGRDGQPVFSVIKQNGEYKLNLDFSLVCKKRRALDAVFNEMIRQGIMDDFGMFQESIGKINEIIRENGFEVACALCFVDSKRYRQAMIADQFTMMFNKQVLSLVKKGSGQKVDFFNFGGDETLKNTGTGIDTLADDELDWTAIDKILAQGKAKTVEYKIAKYLKEHPEGRKLVMRGDFMSTKGFDALKINDQDLLSLYNSKKGAGGPKAAQSDVQYLNDILKNAGFNQKAAYEVGGVRIQSFSDYMGRMVFDYVQMIGDLAAKQLPAHSYTKEYLYALQFGLTGIKINMSLVPDVVAGAPAGLDKNGNYAWKDGQSFGSTVYDNRGARMTAAEGFELAKRIQNAKGYSKNCGTIAVGVSDEHIRKMLDDPEIRMIIPYHKSSLNHILAIMNNIDKYKDYTKVQNTRKNGKKLESGDFNFNEALQRLGDAKAAANEYLAWCEKNGYTPKFDEFADHENYYKLLEDFSCYDTDGVTNTPLSAVQLNFPTAEDAFGSMQDLIREGLEEDTLLQANMDRAVPDIVKQIQAVLPGFEQSVKQGKKKSAAKATQTVQAERPAAFSKADVYYSEYNKPINAKDIQRLQSIGPISINAFTQNDLLKTQKWAYKYYKQMGTKSPFFRAWFGEWRAHDTANSSEVVAFGYSERGQINNKKRTIQNTDTGFQVLVDDTVVEDSMHYAIINGDQKQISQLLYKIDQIVKNAVLLDTRISEKKSGNKKGRTTFMHHLYAPVTINGAPFLARLLVEESGLDSEQRAYNLQRITMSDLSRAQFQELIHANREKYAYKSDALTVAQVYDLVKQHDEGFRANPHDNLDPSLLNEEGTPKLVDGMFTNYNGQQKSVKNVGTFDRDKASPKFSREDVEAAAIGHFGTTDSFRTAGYLLKDGTMLDFSGAHWLEGYDEKYIADWRSKNDIRQVDHEDIFEAYEALGEDFPSDSGLAFMKRGNIRLVPEASGIEIYSGVEPSAAQYRMIREFVREMADDSFTVDLTKDRRHRAGTLQYTGKVSAERVVGDIKQFYKTGEIRQQSAVSQFYSKEDVAEQEILEDMPEGRRYEALKNRRVTVRTADRTAEYTEEINALDGLDKAMSKAEKVLIPLAKKLGILNRSMTSPEIDIDFTFSKNNGLHESTQKQLRYGGNYQDFAKALIHIDQILQDAVLIEKHTDKYKGTVREDPTLENVSVLMGAFRDGDYIIPVQFEIKKSSNYGGRLYMTVAMTKIRADVFGRAIQDNQTHPSLISASEYMIADIFREINPEDKHFLKYVPDQFLNKAQTDAKNKALEEDAKRIASYEKKQSGQFSREDVKPEELQQKLKESEAARARVERALRVAKKQAEYWRSEFDKPGKKGIYRANQSDIRKFASAILAEYQWTTVKASDISERLTQITEGFMRQEDVADLYNIALEIANEIIDNSFVRIDNEMNIRGLDSKTDADWIKEHLKGTSGYVYIAKQDQADIASQLGEDYGNFRKRWQKYGIRLTSEIGTAARKGSLRTIDSLYNEIASLYGLKENVYTISEMVEILDAVMTEDLVNPYYDSRSELSWSDWDYVTELAEIIYEGAISGEVRQYWTRAERAERKADMEKAHLVNKLADTREALQEAKEQGAEKLRRERAKTKQVRQKLNDTRRMDAQKLRDLRQQKNERMREIIQEERQKRKDLVSRNRENRERRETRAKIWKLQKEAQQMVLRGTKESYVPANLMRAMAEMLSVVSSAELRQQESRMDRIDRQLDEMSLTEEQHGKKAGYIQKAIDRLADVQARYADIASDPMYAYTYSESVKGLLEQLRTYLYGTHLTDGDMSADTLKQIYNIMNAMMYVVKNANKLTAMEYKEGIREFAREFNNEMNHADAKRGLAGVMQENLMWQMRPDTFFSYLCGYARDNVGQKIQQMFVQGTQRKLTLQRDFYNLFRDITEARSEADRKAYREMTQDPLKNLVGWGLKDVNGEDVFTTRGMMLQAYMLLEQEDSRRSLAIGGFRLPNLKEYYHGNVQAAYGKFSSLTENRLNEYGDLLHHARELRESLEGKTEAEQAEIEEQIQATLGQANQLLEEAMTHMAEIKAAIEKQLTDFDRRIIQQAHQWYEYSGQKLDETNMALYGFKKPRPKGYVPIHRDLTSVASVDIRDMQNTVNLENAGFTKSRVKSTAPILLTDIFMELDNNQNKMSNFYGFVQVQRDFNAIWKAKVPGQDLTVEGKIAEKFGKGQKGFMVSGEQYIENYIKSLVGGSHDVHLLSTLYGNAAAATLSLNPKVALSQLASIPTAAAELGWAPVFKGLARGIRTGMSTKAKQELAQKDVWFWQRYRGEGGMREFAEIKNNRGSAVGRTWNRIASTKIGGLLLNWCQDMDTLATAAMWAMSEEYVKAKGIDINTEEGQQAVSDAYRNTIRKTQPNYTATERSDLLRDKREAMKFLTMYKTQSNQNLNILIEATGEFQRARKDLKAGAISQAEMRQATAKLANSYSAVILGGSLMYAVLRTVANFLMGSLKAYRDDDDELTAESIAKGTAKEFLSSMAGMDALGGMLYDILYSGFSGEKYYGISDTAMGAISDVASGTVKMFQSFFDDEEGNEWEAIHNEIKSLMTLAGIPLGNAEKFIDAAEMYYNDLQAGTFGQFEGNVERKAAQEAHRLLDAFRDGDADKAAELFQALQDSQKGGTDWKRRQQAETYVRNQVKKWYVDDAELSEDQAREILTTYGGMTADEADAQLREWLGIIEQGYDYGDAKDAYISGDLSDDEILLYATTYMGLKGQDADDAITNLRCEKDTGYAYKDLMQAYVDGAISEQEAIDYRMKYGGYNRTEAEETVTKWRCEKETGVAYSRLEEAYVDGVLTKQQAVALQVKYGGKNQGKAEEAVTKWTCEKETGVKYADIEEAYIDGKITRQQVISWEKKYGGRSQDKAEEYAARYEFARKTGVEWSQVHEGFATGRLKESDLLAGYKSIAGFDDDKAHAYVEVAKWIRDVDDEFNYEKYQKWQQNEDGLIKANVPKPLFAKVAEAWADDPNLKSDYVNGKLVTDSKMKKMMAYIGALDIPADQKTALAYAFYKDGKKIKKYKTW